MTKNEIQRSTNMLLVTSNTEQDLVALINQYKDHCNWNSRNENKVDQGFARVVVKGAYHKLASLG